jgi:hypothetical protein
VQPAVATENRAGADAAMGYPRFGMLDLLKLLSGLIVGRYCQLSRPWYARCVGGAAARVGKILCPLIALPALTERGPEKGALSPLS